jgi:hypothetical protein
VISLGISELVADIRFDASILINEPSSIEKNKQKKAISKLMKNLSNNSFVSQIQRIPEKQHPQVAIELINNKYYTILIKNIDILKGLDMEFIALKLIERDKAVIVTKNLNIFD